ncbi:MAG: C4-dicarboxylate ABC transporter [Verrucomicrobia bacterium GWF2_51_19]|nr:MAG: C4-dicarboxylate ABC transporter [Verrucomicrobia bacterium GWF2_51_19]HCJ11766.1 C4-dicarboxylate ABC transporter [Opitutae bacterium]
MNAKTQSRIENFHISFFAIALGLAGFTLATQKLETLLWNSETVTRILLSVSIVVLGLVSVLYMFKGIRHFPTLKQEWLHPVKMNFFPLIAKTLLVLSVVFLEINLSTSKIFWIVGTVAQGVLSLTILSFWFSHKAFEIQHSSPAWFIPIVGSMIVPIAGVAHGYVELSWFFYATGFFFWLFLSAILLYRLIFFPPLPDKLLPTFFIFFAPPAIGFIAFCKLTNLTQLTAFPRLLFYFSLFLFALALIQLPRLLKIRFFLSWWAYSFPLAAITLAILRMFTITKQAFFLYFAMGTYALLVAILCLLIYKTIRGILHHSLCVED